MVGDLQTYTEYLEFMKKHKNIVNPMSQKEFKYAQNLIQNIKVKEPLPHNS